jgi:hypothetical protein
MIVFRGATYSPPTTSLNAENQIERAVMVALLFADFKRAIKVLLDTNGKLACVRLLGSGDDD